MKPAPPVTSFSISSSKEPGSAALAAGSRWGVLIKSTGFLESLADVDTVVLDNGTEVRFAIVDALRETVISQHLAGETR